jgi:hypothetical protein
MDTEETEQVRWLFTKEVPEVANGLVEEKLRETKGTRTDIEAHSAPGVESRGDAVAKGWPSCCWPFRLPVPQ